MIVFKLPDLGEGLAEAEIREWHIQEGQEIKREQLLVSVETAKAVVDIPSPFAGKVEKLFGEVGSIIETGQPLVGFHGEEHSTTGDTSVDKGTVVGELPSSDAILSESSAEHSFQPIRITPEARALAKRLKIDYNQLTDLNQLITPALIQEIAKKTQPASPLDEKKIFKETASKANLIKGENEIPLNFMRRAMFDRMTHSHQQVVPVTVSEEVDIFSWYGRADVTLKIIRAIAAACKIEPILNATFDSDHLSYRLNEKINLGLAVDTVHGLYVPVIKDINQLNDEAIRNKINEFKQQALAKNIKQNDLQGASITLSNFGSLSGRFANPIILPPQVAIIGIGKLYHGVVAVQEAIAIHPLLPISLTFDHRLITGGEAARFLESLLKSLEKAESV